MLPSLRMRLPCLILLWAALAGMNPWCSAQTPGAMATARRWVEAKFLGQVEPNPPQSYLLVYLKSGSLGRNEVEGRTLRIVKQEYSQGLHFPSEGRVRVMLSSPAKSFEATVGVDSNPLGYYSNTGRGAALASVDVGGKTAFQTPVLHEGMAGVPVRVDLRNCTEFDLTLSNGGGGEVFRVDFDQADWAEARVTLADGKVVWLGDLPIGPLRPPFTAEPPFSFRFDGHSSRAFLKTWESSRQSRRLDENRTEHTLTYSDSRSGLVVRAVAVEYNDFPVVEWTLYFKNSGSQPTPMLEDIQALDAMFERDEEGEFILHHNKGSQTTPTDFEPYADRMEPTAEKRITAGGGRPTNTDLCYFNIALPGDGVILGIGWPGQWAAHFKRDEGTGLQVRVGQELTHFKLLPGEEARTPLVALVFWQGDWIDGQNVWRRWMITHNLPRPGGKLPSPILSSGTNGYTIEMQGANEQNQKEFMEDYFKLGWKFDYWWMDAGWYKFKDGWWMTGTWEPDPVRFPNGLRPVSDFAHAHGLKTILWNEPERVTPGSWLADHHPEWLIQYKEQRNRLLNLGNPEALKWVTNHFDQLLTTQGIDLYRQDFNFDPLDYWRANDPPDRQGITEIRHVEGYLAYWDELRRRHPAMLIDSCAGGGRRNDLETLRRAVPLWRSDYSIDDAPAMQDLTYGLAMWIPYSGTAIHSSNPYSFRSSMVIAPTVQIDPRSEIVDFPKLEHLAAQWREVAPYYYGDYYPLTPYTTENDAWMAWQFNRPAAGDGMVQVFRRSRSPIEEETLKLRGLDPAGEYSVTNLDVPGAQEFMGRELEERGLPVKIRNEPEAVIIVYKRIQKSPTARNSAGL